VKSIVPITALTRRKPRVRAFTPMSETTEPQRPTPDGEPEWFAVRCLFHDNSRRVYEERVTLWRAADFDQAIGLAEDEAREYAGDIEETKYIGLAQAYHLSDEPMHGAEVFSLMRQSPLAPSDYINRFFDTGTERQTDL
jgi:hypothetical protein